MGILELLSLLAHGSRSAEGLRSVAPNAKVWYSVQFTSTRNSGVSPFHLAHGACMMFQIMVHSCDLGKT